MSYFGDLGPWSWYLFFGLAPRAESLETSGELALVIPEFDPTEDTGRAVAFAETMSLRVSKKSNLSFIVGGATSSTPTGVSNFALLDLC